MADEKLLEYQKSEYNEEIAKYFFEASGGGAETATSPEKIALKGGIKLHFFRYSFIETENDYDVATDLDRVTIDKREYTPNELTVTHKEIIPIEDFYLARTFLRAGYLYIIDKIDNGKFKEYEVDESGLLSGIEWSAGNNGMIRESTGSLRSFITVNSPGEYYIAYSPVQWSKEFFDEINASDEIKEKRMHTINCVGLEIGGAVTSHEVVSYNQVKVVSFKDHPRKQSFRTDLLEVHHDEVKQTEKGDNHYYEDMFVALHDPVGCANDIAEVLSKKMTDFNGLVAAIQTGETEEEAVDRFSKIPVQPPIISFNKDYNDMFSLALVSYKMVYSNKENTRTYDGGKAGTNSIDTHFPYQPNTGPTYEYDINPYSKSDFGVITKRKSNNYVSNEKIREGLHREKVEGILGVHQRREKREIVLKYRDKLGNFLKSEYIKKGLYFYSDNAPEYCVFGIEELYKSILLLYTNPYAVDRHLLLDANNDLEQDVYHETDTWITWINKYKNLNKPNNADDPFEKLMVHELSIEKKLLDNWIALATGLAGVINGKLNLHALDSAYFKSKTIASKITGKNNYQQVIDEGYTEIVKKLNKITVTATKGGVPKEIFYFGNTHSIQIDASVLGAKGFDSNLHVIITGPDGKNIKEFNADLIEHNKLYGKNASDAGGDHAFVVGDKVKDIDKETHTKNTINQNNAKRFNQKAYNFLNSRGFTSALTGLQVINLSYASLGLYDAIRKEKSLLVKGKNTLNVIGITAELTEASLRLQQAHYNAIGKELTKSVASGLKNRIAVVGAIGGAVATAMCLWEGIVTYNKLDRDAAIAWGLAGVAFGVSTAAGIWGGSVLLLSGPVGWIALGIGFILVVLATIFTDSNLEFYFKHFLFSGHKSLPPNGRSAMEYNRYLFDNKKLLVDSSNTEIVNKYMHPADAIASLHDLTVCTDIVYSIKDKATYIKGKRVDSYATSFGISINFNQFLTSTDQLDVKGILLESADDDTTPFNLIVKESNIVPLKNGQKQLQAIVNIPETKHKLFVNELFKDTVLILAVRVALDKKNNHYFPHLLQNTPERYMAVKIGLERKTFSLFNLDEEDEFVFDSLENLKLDKTW